MKKKLTLWILLLPCLIFGQVEVKDGALTIDFGKKKKTEQDSLQKNNTTEDEKPARVKKQKPESEVPEEEENPDFKKEGIFKALFIAGLNLSQIDGDEQAGYVQPGAHLGIGTMVKFHKNLSVSAEILYGMKGAYKRLNANESPQYMFRQNWDYIQVPLMFNVHDKKLVMASVGLSLNYLIRNKLRYEAYDLAGNISDSLSNYGKAVLGIEPKKFDLGGVVAFQFLIKKVFGIGARFEYSLIGLKPALNNTKIKQMHNNSITIRFMYILDPVSLKKKQ
jgi:hypothetical protein